MAGERDREWAIVAAALARAEAAVRYDNQGQYLAARAAYSEVAGILDASVLRSLPEDLQARLQATVRAVLPACSAQAALVTDPYPGPIACRPPPPPDD